MTAVEVRNLSVRFGRRQALDQISAAAEPGKVTVVIGPNAAGKSTLLRACAGLLRPDQGSVTLAGRPVHALRPRELAARVAWVPQRPIVSAAFSVREVISFGRYALRRDEARIECAIEDMQLGELAATSFHELSVGQQQRVTLARALAQHEPGGLVVLDEPASAMDLRHARSARAVLQRLAERGAIVIIAMHEIGEAAELADHIWLLDEGRLIAEGSPAEALALERIRAVFGADFERVQRGDGSEALIRSD